MIAYLEKFVNSINRPKTYLILANILLVFFLILLSNLGVLPIGKMGDFAFYAIIFLVFALYRPGWAFLLFVGTIVLENINLAPGVLGMAIRPYQFIGGITFGALIIRWLIKRLNFDFPKFNWADGAVTIFGISGFLSVVGALNRGVSFKQSVVALSFVALYFLARVFVQNMDDLKRIVPFFLSSSLVVIFYGLWQNIRFMRGLNSFEAMPGRPNATFTEADWLGMYLVFLIAVVYALVYYFNNTSEDQERLNLKSQISNSKQIQNFKLLNFRSLYFVFCVLFLIAIFTLLILTVSRSAWVGAVVVTVIFLLTIFTQLKLNPKEWQWKETFQIKIGILTSIVLSIAVVYIFHLTSFQLFNRVQSTGSGMQKITISCEKDIVLPESVKTIDELAAFNCRHINLEEIETEKSAGNMVKEINRPDPNINIRQVIYQKSWETIEANPILGIGWGGIGQILGKDSRGNYLNSSNIFLEVWLGSGILGIASFVLLWSYIIFRAIRKFLEAGDNSKTIGLFVLLGSAALLVTNLFNAGIFLGFLWVFLGVAVSLTAKK